MAIGPRLDLRQTQSLVMTPQLQQAIKLLGLSNLEIEAFIGEALEANPLLDLGEPEPDAGGDSGETHEPRRMPPESSPVDRLIDAGRVRDDNLLDIGSGALDVDRDTGDPGPFPDWGASNGAGGVPIENRAPIEDRTSASISLAEHLEQQIGACAPDPGVGAIARYIIALLDEAGYLPARLDGIADELGVPIGDAEAALALVQSLDPTGVGARSLAECIALQAKEADRHDPAMARLIDNLELVGRGELARIKRLCGVDDEDLREMLCELRRYDPKPGLRFDSVVVAPVTPDIVITARADGGWDIALNEATLPRLVVNRAYYLELRDACDDRAARSWLSDKLADAGWLIKALDQRQKTILKVSAEIVRQQEGFFRGGVSHLKPLTLRTVAEGIGMHESTVSRVTSNKYLQCGRGTFELKYFFTSGVAAAAGGGNVSAEAVKAAIRQLVKAELPSAVLSDDALVDLLRAEGFDLARRTVAKYREAIGLSSSVQRRRQKALTAAR